MENGNSRWTSALYLFLAGGVAGVGAGLLLAPQSGKATRETMRRKLHETGEFARGLRDKVARQGDEIREGAARRLTKMASAITPSGPRKVQEGRAASA